MAGCHVKVEQAFNLIFGYNAVYTEYGGGTVSGTAYQWSGTPVPSGEVWVVQFIFARDTTSNPGTVRHTFYDGSNYHTCSYVVSPGLRVPVVFVGNIPMAAGMYPVIFLGGVVNGDSIDAGVWGYKMVLSQ